MLGSPDLQTGITTYFPAVTAYGQSKKGNQGNLYNSNGQTRGSKQIWTNLIFHFTSQGRIYLVKNCHTAIVALLFSDLTPEFVQWYRDKFPNIVLKNHLK